MVKTPQNRKSYLTIKQMRAVDHAAVKYGMPIELMMENAGKGIVSCLDSENFEMKNKTIICIAGRGNNGGGVIAAARHLSCAKIKVTLILVNSTVSHTIPSKFHLSLIRKNPKIKKIMFSKKTRQRIFSLINGADFIVDGIFGTGFKGHVNEPEYSIIDQINKSKAFVISNDLPSGINADTANDENISVKSNFVAVLHKPKKWMMQNNFLPKFSIINLGIPPEIDPPYSDSK